VWVLTVPKYIDIRLNTCGKLHKIFPNLFMSPQ
jgi:hypothetical protein